MPAAKDSPAEDAPDREISTTRLVAATRERLFAAFSDPNELTQWWGPKDFTSTLHEFDLRPGGKWRLVLHAPDGADYENEKVFTEVTKPERIVFRNVSDVHGFLMTIAFSARNGGTLVTWRLLFDSAAECAKIRAIVEEANEQNLDRLEAHVRTVF